MITATIKHSCHECKSKRIIKYGKKISGKQCYKCKNCGTIRVLKYDEPRYSEQDKKRILSAYEERASMRGISRIFGVSRKTLADWIQKKLQQPLLKSTLCVNDPLDTLELDEMWSFVYSKTNKRWIWWALSRSTRQIVAWYIGDRSTKSCRQLWERVPVVLKECVTYSDFWESYKEVIQTGKHHSVGKESGETAHVERWNNTIRQRLGRLVRKSLSFSKSEEMHEAVIANFVYKYNLEILSNTRYEQYQS